MTKGIVTSISKRKSTWQVTGKQGQEILTTDPACAIACCEPRASFVCWWQDHQMHRTPGRTCSSGPTLPFSTMDSASSPSRTAPWKRGSMRHGSRRGCAMVITVLHDTGQEAVQAKSGTADGKTRFWELTQLGLLISVKRKKSALYHFNRMTHNDLILMLTFLPLACFLSYWIHIKTYWSSTFAADPEKINHKEHDNK